MKTSAIFIGFLVLGLTLAYIGTGRVKHPNIIPPNIAWFDTPYVVTLSNNQSGRVQFELNADKTVHWRIVVKQ
jgi:hypothetical protein